MRSFALRLQRSSARSPTGFGKSPVAAGTDVGAGWRPIRLWVMTIRIPRPLLIAVVSITLLSGAGFGGYKLGQNAGGASPATSAPTRASMGGALAFGTFANDHQIMMRSLCGQIALLPAPEHIGANQRFDEAASCDNRAFTSPTTPPTPESLFGRFQDAIFQLCGMVQEAARVPRERARRHTCWEGTEFERKIHELERELDQPHG